MTLSQVTESVSWNTDLDFRLPSLLFAGPAGEQLRLPGALWPELAAVGGGPVCFAPVTRAQANLLIDRWGHPLGAYRRPFGYQAWAYVVDGEPIGVAVGASTVSAAVYSDLNRRDVVELARIVRSPAHPRALRALLRVWTDYLAPRWPYWPVQAAVSYALPNKAGNLYAFDGWTRVGERRPSTGGGTWSSRPVPLVAAGRKTLFVYRYPKGQT